MFQHTFLYFKSIENVLILFLDPKRPQMLLFYQERHLVENVDFFTKMGTFLQKWGLFRFSTSEYFSMI